jgi:hypothetical protein
MAFSPSRLFIGAPTRATANDATAHDAARRVAIEPAATTIAPTPAPRPRATSAPT